MISSTTTRSQYTGDAATKTFPYAFLILDSAHLVVVVTTSGVDSVKTLNTDYTLSGVNSPSGGSVVFLTAPAAGTTVTLYRNVPYTQLVDYVPNSNFPAETHEAALDKLTMEVQQLADTMGRSLHYPVTEAIATTSEIPAKTTRAGTLVGFDVNGDPYYYHIDPALLTINISGNVNTGNIVDGAVTASKLALTLNLTGKIITLPTASVSPVNLVNNFDCSGLPLLGFKFKDAEIVRREIDPKTGVYPSGTAKDLLPSRVGINLSSSDRLVVGSGGYDGVYTYQGIKNSYGWWANGTTSSLIFNVATGTYTLYSDITGTTPVLSADATYTGTVFDPIDADWNPGGPAFNMVVLDLESALLTEVATKLAVNGSVRATQFIGDGSKLTGINSASIGFGALPVTGDSDPAYGRSSPTGGNAAFSFSTGDSGVMVGGYQAAVNYLTDAGSFTGSLRRAIIRPGALVGPFTIDSPSGNRSFQMAGTPTYLGTFQAAVGAGITKIVHCQSNIFVLANGCVFGMGRNNKGQLGQGDTTNRPYFVGIKVGGAAGHTLEVSDISVTPSANTGAADDGDVTVIVRTATGKVYTWGANAAGQCGTGGTVAQTSPFNNAAWAFNSEFVDQVLTVGLNTWVKTQIVAGVGGKVYGTGFNNAGALGISGDLTQKTTFTQMTNTGGAVKVQKMYAGGRYVGATDCVSFFAVDSSGNLYGTGYNGAKSLGDNTAVNKSVLTATHASIGQVSKLWVMGGDRVWCAAICTGTSLNAGSFVNWGYNGGGQLGDVTGSTTDSGVANVTGPNAVFSTVFGAGFQIKDVVGIGYLSAYGATYVLSTNGKVCCTGINANGESGVGDTVDDTAHKKWKQVPFPYTIASLHPVTDHLYASGTIYAADTAGRIWGCGRNDNYQLGLGHAITAVSTPNQVRI